MHREQSCEIKTKPIRIFRIRKIWTVQKKVRCGNNLYFANLHSFLDQLASQYSSLLRFQSAKGFELF